MDAWRDQLNRMVDELRDGDSVKSAEIEQAFRSVPRHLFLPGADRDRVYSGAAIPTKYHDGLPVSSSSQPAVMALMLEQLNLRPGLTVLEIGAGTGYNAAIMAELVGAEGQVVTVDIDEDICASARRNLSAAGYPDVQVICADGGLGHLDAAPYDRIIATVGIYDISDAWVEQLAPGGLFIAPLWIRGQQAIVTFVRDGNVLRSRSITGGAFMRLRGSLAGPEAYIQTPNQWMISAEDPGAIDVETITALLDEQPRRHDELLYEFEPSLAFSLFLATRDPRLLVLGRNGPDGQPQTYLLGLFESRSRSLCAIASRLDDREQKQQVWSLGGDAMFSALRQHMDDWKHMGRPTLEALEITACPAGSVQDAEADVIKRTRYDLLVRWNVPDGAEP